MLEELVGKGLTFFFGLELSTQVCMTLVLGFLGWYTIRRLTTPSERR